jgi:hypothetical protein
MAMLIAAAIVDAEDAIHAADHTTDTRAYRASNNAADRTRCAVAPVNAFIRAAFHAAKDALGVRRDRQGQQRQRGRHKREAPMRRCEHEQGCSLHLEISVESRL